MFLVLHLLSLSWVFLDVTVVVNEVEEKEKRGLISLLLDEQ